MEQSPFPGYYVYCIPELYYQNQWVPILSGCGNQGSGSYAWGAFASGDFNDSNTIIIKTMPTGLVINGGTSYTSNIDIRVATPCRVKVWKIGKIPT